MKKFKTGPPPMITSYLERLVDLTDLEANQLIGISTEQAREVVRRAQPEEVLRLRGSFALVAKDGKKVRMARSLDRPLRYFLAKRHEGPALVVANRIDKIHQWLKEEKLNDQFQPNYTRMVPAHHVVEIHLVGCPDPDPVYTRFFSPRREALAPDLDLIGRCYIESTYATIREWLEHVPAKEPIGVCFSGGIDSGAVFLLLYKALLESGGNPSRLKAFTLDLGHGEDLLQARAFLKALNLELFLEPITARPEEVDPVETLRIIEDYKRLDVEAASMLLLLARNVRVRYPDWKYLVDGDGGDENLKDYPIEENPELTIKSVVHNRMLYQEGWGLGTIKHSLTYSGGLSRACSRTYATLSSLGLLGFSPFTDPRVIEVAEGIPFIELTQYDVEKLYALKGEVVRRGIKAVTGLDMPVFPKRRFQHGAIHEKQLREVIPQSEQALRRKFLSLYA
jgi:asparagine synthase (glutamine-hydrolysing)